MKPSAKDQNEFLDLMRNAGAPMDGIIGAGVMSKAFEGPPVMLVWAHTINLAASANALADFTRQGGSHIDVDKLAGIASILRTAADQFDTVVKPQ